MTTAIFSIERDNEIVAAGGFFCEVCLEGKPSTEQSKDPRYCRSCFKSRPKEEKPISPIPKKPIPASRPKPPETPPVPKKPVAKIPDKGLEGSGIMQRRGRPKKEGEVHRATDWRRRQKVTQGVLL